MKYIAHRLAACALIAWCGLSGLATPTARADTIRFTNGASVTGKYSGGDQSSVVIRTADGAEQRYATTDIASIAFGPAVSPPPPPQGAGVAAAVQPAAAQPSAAAPAKPVNVPAGSLLTVRMDTQVSSSDPGGKKFSATLVSDLVSDNNTVVAKAGSTVIGQVEQSRQAGRLAGKSELKLTLTGVNIDGRTAPVMTTNFAEAGKSSFRKTARNVTAGAVIGNAVDDDGGAGKGAAIGAGVSLIRKGDSVTVPPGAILEFRLAQPFTWQAK